MAVISDPGPSTRSTAPMNYHVFLSFRGIDTRKNFTDHLYFALLRKGIVTFKDDEELDRGQVISEKLLKAIEESVFAIIVLSKNYGSSSWCLDELQKIIESKQDLGQTVFPIFHGIDPSDVRHQRGNFATAFEEHERRFPNDKVRRWRDALTKVANLSGWDTNDKHEAKIVEDIAKSIWNKLCVELPSNFEHLVGIQSKVDKIISLLKIGLDDKCFIGIWGMGGVGKTTLARVVYDAIRSKFDTSCFLANVKEDSEKGGLVYLQKKLLSCLQLGKPKINDSYDGVEVIRKFLCHKKVLIVLDDVSHRSQLDNMARNKEWFGAGSKIIITTRDVQLLTNYEQFEGYEVKTLDRNESLELLRQKAFEKYEQFAWGEALGYLELLKEVVEYSCGLPLALEVLGSFLCKRNQFEWKDTLDKLKQDLHKDILNPLRISYDGLEDEEWKTIFLDIACFFNWEAKVEVTNILKICGLHPTIGIKVLIEKSLLSCYESDSYSWLNAKESQDMYDLFQKMRRDIFLPTLHYQNLLQGIVLEESLYMHDLLQEMGRNIVLQESPDAGKRSRLWSLKDIDFVLKGNKGTEKVQSIALDTERHFEATWHPDCFSKMHNLRLLDLSHVHLSRSLNSLPNALKVLRWDYYALKSLPPIDQLYELEGLQLCNSKIRKLWNGTLSLDKLRIINLSNSEDLIETPDFSGTPNLEKIFLNDCKNLVRVHKSLGQLKNLVKLSLAGCENLVTLPSYLEMNNLEEFNLSRCSKLQKLPKFGEKMRSLFFLDVRKTSVKKIPSSIIHLSNLKYFDLSYCHKLKSIPKLPPNLIIVAYDCPFLEPGSALQHLLASNVSKHAIVVQGPSHLLYDDIEYIPRQFERREHRRSKDTTGEFVTITADIPDVADYKGEWWGIAVCLSFQCLEPAWRGFSINWKFQDYCHPNKRHAAMISPYLWTDYRLYIGFYPFDKKDSRQHPSGVGSQVDLTLSIPNTNDGCTGRYYNDLKIVDCGWSLLCERDIHARSTSSVY